MPARCRRSRACGPPRSCAATLALSRPPLPAAVRGRATARPYRAAATAGAASRSSSPTSRSTPGHPSRAGAGRGRRAGDRCARRARPAAVGSARPGVRRAVPARPARPAAARRRAPLRGRVAPASPRTPARRRRRVAATGCTSRGRRAPARRSGGRGAVRRRRPARRRRRCGRRWPSARRRRARRAWSRSPTARRCRGPQLAAGVDRELAAGLAATGVRPGDRVALLVPPRRRPDRRAVRAAGVSGRSWSSPTPGSGCAALGRALRGAGRGLRRRHRAAGSPPPARCAGPGAGSPPAPSRAVALRALGAAVDARRAGRRAAGGRPPRRPSRAADAERRGAVHLRLHRSGQGRRLHAPQLGAAARRAAARRTASTGDDRLVAAFAPFALLGPALGIASAVPRHGRHRARAR